jgi:hypothetical protein
VKKMFEDIGVIAVHHGFACAESNNNDKQNILHHALRLPGYASGAVFLNGWNLRYLNGPHNVATMTTVIRNIKSQREHLQWDAISYTAAAMWRSTTPAPGVTAKPSSAHNVPGGAHKVSLLALRPVTLGLPVKR